MAPLTAIDRDFRDTVSFLYTLERFGILLGLDNITGLLDKIGNPHRRFPVVHVAGSNGKGSTASFITGILNAAGLKTALYTSPHLNDFRERIRFNGELVSKEEVVRAAALVKAVYDPERTTYFEFTTALAFECMARYQPDVAIIEVGLGGRLDATNTVDPLVTVITDISREHEDYLGVGLASVAREKAGIIKKGIPLITGASRREARNVILDIARSFDARVREFGKDFSGKRTGDMTFTYRSSARELDDLTLSMPGTHQIKNASLAVAVVEELISRGYAVSTEAICSGIRSTRFPGRFEVLRTAPDVIIDGAHTPEGMRMLKSTLRRRYPGVRPLFLLGMLKDKNYEKLASIIVPDARHVVCVEPQGERALAPEELAEVVRHHGVSAEAAMTVAEGLERLLSMAGDGDVIVAAGSLYMIGPVRRLCGVADA